jgi:uncharacterized membrane protein
MALFSGEGWLFLLRWLHFLAGITWIGLLYYFNFVQTPFFASAEAPVRVGMLAGGLVARALWWFRWGAMITFLTGWLIILHKIGQLGLAGFFNTSYGWAIFFGGMLGSLMWFNVWFIIWPAQQVVMASAAQVAVLHGRGQPPDHVLGDHARRQGRRARAARGRHDRSRGERARGHHRPRQEDAEHAEGDVLGRLRALGDPVLRAGWSCCFPDRVTAGYFR